MGYVPGTTDERQKMLNALGTDLDGLFADIPNELMLRRPLNLPAGKTEFETADFLNGLAEKNKIYKTIFRGAGAYRHFIPAVVKSLGSLSGFVTAYTPYQAELSQGILQAIFEYQTMICRLTGMDSSNASVYDGASAAAEAGSMCRERGRIEAVVSGAVKPHTLDIIKTYCRALDIPVRVAPERDGRTDTEALKNLVTAQTAAVYIEQPNYFGLIEDVESLGQIAHEGGARYIVGANPISLAVLKPPGECGADIAVGEGQPLGLGLNYGGPYLGFMACRKDLTRKLPGRIVGETTDIRGNRAFVLTLQAREQHIRREKAASSICSNQALCALTATIYLSAMGPAGLTDISRQCISKAHYMAERITSVKGFEMVYPGEFYNEFVTAAPDAGALNDFLSANGILGGLATTKDHILWCATEVNTREEIDALYNLICTFAGRA